MVKVQIYTWIGVVLVAFGTYTESLVWVLVGFATLIIRVTDDITDLKNNINKLENTIKKDINHLKDQIDIRDEINKLWIA